MRVIYGLCFGYYEDYRVSSLFLTKRAARKARKRAIWHLYDKQLADGPPKWPDYPSPRDVSDVDNFHAATAKDWRSWLRYQIRYHEEHIGYIEEFKLFEE